MNKTTTHPRIMAALSALQDSFGHREEGEAWISYEDMAAALAEADTWPRAEPVWTDVIESQRRELQGLRNKLLGIRMDAELAQSRALDFQRDGRSPADAMALSLFHSTWEVPEDRGEAFANEYFWSLQRNIVENLAKAAASVGARIVWDERVKELPMADEVTAPPEA